MGSEQLTSVMTAVKGSVDPELKARMDRENEAIFSSARLWDDGIIPPSETRAVLGLCLRAALGGGKTVGRSTRFEVEKEAKFGIFRM